MLLGGGNPLGGGLFRVDVGRPPLAGGGVECGGNPPGIGGPYTFYTSSNV